jgi:hypothetical protein
MLPAFRKEGVVVDILRHDRMLALKVSTGDARCVPTGHKTF